MSSARRIVPTPGDPEVGALPGGAGYGAGLEEILDMESACVRERYRNRGVLIERAREDAEAAYRRAVAAYTWRSG